MCVYSHFRRAAGDVQYLGPVVAVLCVGLSMCVYLHFRRAAGDVQYLGPVVAWRSIDLPVLTEGGQAQQVGVE